jgi:predicted NAD/FAD-binding protein
MSDARKRIAVVGGGVAGITTAYLLDRHHEVTIFEAGSYLGGHTNTITIEKGPDSGIGVDTGFIVLNDKNYPLFHRFLKRLDVPVRWSNMSFGYYDPTRNFYYAGRGFNGLFAQRCNLASPSFYAFIAEVLRFGREGQAALRSEILSTETLGKFLEERDFSRRFIADYLLPMGAAIWSTPEMKVMDFPALSFLHFFRNHGLLSLKERPRWQTVVGGSSSYVKKFIGQFTGEIRLASAVLRVERDAAGCRIFTSDTDGEAFDKVIFAAHADQSLSMLAEPSEDEQELLGAWRYQSNDTILHSDASLLPPYQRAWASWNYRGGSSEGGGGSSVAPAALSYWMNLLQGLETQRNYFVSLNSSEAIREDKILARIDYSHPQYTTQAMDTQAKLSRLNGVNNSYFCGSYFGYGFHEDAVRSAVNVAKEFGIEL